MDKALEIARSNRLVSRAASLGVKDIVVQDWVREACRECRYFGKSWSCPPAVGEIKFLVERLHKYSQAVFVEFTGSRDKEGLEAAVLEIETRLKKAGFEKAVGFFVSPCSACGDCTYPEKCVNPEACRPTGEAWGIDLLVTSQNAGIPVEIVAKGEDFTPVTIFLVE